MTKRKNFRQRRLVSLLVENDKWKDFLSLCDEERKSTSLMFDELITLILEKKALGEQTPINISYGKEEEKPLQSDIRQWLPRDVAIKMAVNVPMDASQWRHLGETCQIIARKIDTGYLNSAKSHLR